MNDQKPRFDLPVIEEETRPFWEAAANGRLMIARCGSCGYYHYYPRPFCPECWSENIALVEASGEATLYTFSIVRVNDLPPFNERVPYAVAMVDLVEGPRMSTNVIDCDHDALRIGMPLKVVFQEIAPGVSIPRFRPGLAGTAAQ
jgi:uncharacterized OB-fold protein